MTAIAVTFRDAFLWWLDKDWLGRNPTGAVMKLVPRKSADELLDMYYPDMRSHLLEVAAAFDRIERAGGCADPRLEKLRGLAVVAVDREPNRAERFLLHLSRED
jgi:hypothetical protein